MLYHLLYVQNGVDDLNDLMGWTFERLNADMSELLVFPDDSMKNNPVYGLTTHCNWMAGLPGNTVEYLNPIVFAGVDKEVYGELDIFYDQFGLVLVGQKSRSMSMKILGVKTWTRDGTIKLHRASDFGYADKMVMPESKLPIIESDIYYCGDDNNQLKAFVETLMDNNQKVTKSLKTSIDRSGELLPYKKAIEKMLFDQMNLLSRVLKR